MATVQERVASLAAEVRDLKAQLAKEGLPPAKINQHERVLAAVGALRAAKAQLGGDDPASDAAFFARQRAEKDAARRREQAAAGEQRAELQAAEARAPRPLTQRKIFHLFQYAGSGASFWYEPPPRLNAEQTGFGSGGQPCPAVYVTEKWDGTTMQATSSHIFKRLDLWGKRRDGQDPSQRYDLRLLAWRDEDTRGEWRGLEFLDADPRCAEALRPHLAAIAALPAGLCAYFEVVHTEINATFRHLPGFADIRVFDFSREGCGFLPFEETIGLAAETGLPLVGWSRRERLCATELWGELAAAAADGRQYGTAAGALEGFVVREAGSGSRVAKARVEQIPAPPPAERSSAAASRVARHQASALRWDAAYLEAIGLCPAGPAHWLRSPAEGRPGPPG